MVCEWLKAAPQAACSGVRGLRIQKKPELMFRLIVTVVSGGVYTVGGVVTFGASSFFLKGIGCSFWCISCAAV